MYTAGSPYAFESESFQSEQPMGYSKRLSSIPRNIIKETPLKTIESVSKSVKTVLSDEEILDAVPIHELNYNVPMPYFPMNIEDLGEDEFRNDGTRYVQILQNKANMYRSILASAIKANDPGEGGFALPSMSSCKGVLFQLSSGPVMFDRSIPLVYNGYNMYEGICSSLDTYEGLIYIFTEAEVFEVSTETFLNQYRNMFDSIEEKPNSM